jgi:transposase
MPPQRSPLGPISGNRLLGAHLSPYARGVIAGKASAGAKPSEIAAELELEYSTVYRTIQLDLTRHEGASLPRTPRKKSYTEADERILLRHVRLNPKDTYAKIKIACGLACSKSTLRKILKEHGITNWRAKRRPFLTEKNAAARLKWCLERQHWLAEDWALVVWSDECSVERGRGQRDEWVFRTPGQKWHRQMIQTYDAKKNMKVMV